MKKRRKLKRWVKKTLIIIPTTIPIIIITIAITNIKPTLSSSKTIKKISKGQKEMNEKTKEIIEKEELERYTYEEGFYYENLSSKIKTKITGKSFPIEFDENYTKISYDDLRYLKVKYYDFKGIEHNDGELIINKEVAEEVLKIFYELYQNKYPIEKITLVDEYNATDELSMEDNNTSAFNYRLVENSDKLSWHCFGLAIDINPLYNPYIVGSEIYPKNSIEYKDRTKEFQGKIDKKDIAYKTFTKYGWLWGGDFINSKDYQHFYKNIYDESIRERRKEQ